MLNLFITGSWYFLLRL